MSQLSIFASGPSSFLRHLDVVADAGGAPHVVGAVTVVGIVGGEPVGHHRPGVGEVRQLRLVELGEDLRGDLALQEIAGGNDDIVTGFSGEQPRLQGLVGVERVVDDLDAGFPGEILQHPRRHVVRPVVEIDGALLRLRRQRAQRQRRGHRCGERDVRAVAEAHPDLPLNGDAPRPTAVPARYRAWHRSWKSRTAPPTSPDSPHRRPTPVSPPPCSR